MSTTTGRVYLSRIVGQPVFDPAGDRVGKLRDIVVTARTSQRRPRVLGLVVEVLGRRRVFVPIGRMTSVSGGQVIITGVLDVRKFQQRRSETLAVQELFDRHVTINGGGPGTVYDLAMEADARRDWHLTHVAVQEPSKRFGRRGATHTPVWEDVQGLVSRGSAQGAQHLLATMNEMRPADVANALLDLPPRRRLEVAAELGDERLADVLEELPETVQVEILGVLRPARAADVVAEMNPDDAADLLGSMPPATAEDLLARMEPDDADDVRRLLTYEEGTAGSMMTTEPVVLAPDTTIAEALARIREPELIPALASMVYVCRPPVETPTGRFLGVVHFQALLREPPSTLVGAIIDDGIEWPRPESSLAEVSNLLAAYNMVALPVVDEGYRLVGAVTIDDVLDHLLPENWRESSAAAQAGVTNRG